MPETKTNLQAKPVSLELANELLNQLSRKLMVVTDHSLEHLVAKGVIAPMARDGLGEMVPAGMGGGCACGGACSCGA